MDHIIKLADGVSVEVEVDENNPQFVSSKSKSKITTSMQEAKSILAEIIKPITDSFSEIPEHDKRIKTINVSLGLKIDLEGNFILAKSTVGANLALEITIGSDDE
ncbi:MAG: hypothetical protein CMP47_16365 [Rickettsiales bacterium]|jgi:hypothetical protein|nr:hypothetical protein [Rickettsiales bacterium]